MTDFQNLSGAPVMCKKPGRSYSCGSRRPVRAARWSRCPSTTPSMRMAAARYDKAIHRRRTRPRRDLYRGDQIVPVMVVIIAAQHVVIPLLPVFERMTRRAQADQRLAGID